MQNCCGRHFQIYVGCNVRKRTFWHVRSTKIQISLRVLAFWSVFDVYMKKVCILCTDCANAQADLNLRSVHMSEGTFSDIVTVSLSLSLPLLIVWLVLTSESFFSIVQSTTWKKNQNVVCCCCEWRIKVMNNKYDLKTRRKHYQLIYL